MLTMLEQAALNYAKRLPPTLAGSNGEGPSCYHALYGGVHPDGSLIPAVARDPNLFHYQYTCHHWLEAMWNVGLVWSIHYPHERIDPAITAWYFEWLVTESPWVKAGIEARLHDLGDGRTMVTVVAGETPVNLVHNFLIAFRAAHEWTSSIAALYSANLPREKIAYGLVSLSFVDARMEVSDDDDDCGTDDSSVFWFAPYGDRGDWFLDAHASSLAYYKNFVGGVPCGPSHGWLSEPVSMFGVRTLYIPEGSIGQYSHGFGINNVWGERGGQLNHRTFGLDHIKNRGETVAELSTFIQTAVPLIIKKLAENP